MADYSTNDVYARLLAMAANAKIDKARVMKFKGSCEFDDLPLDPEDGDVWDILDDFDLRGKHYPAGTNVAWNADMAEWDVLGGHFELDIPAGNNLPSGQRIGEMFILLKNVGSTKKGLYRYNGNLWELVGTAFKVVHITQATGTFTDNDYETLSSRQDNIIIDSDGMVYRYAQVANGALMYEGLEKLIVIDTEDKTYSVNELSSIFVVPKKTVTIDSSNYDVPDIEDDYDAIASAVSQNKKVLIYSDNSYYVVNGLYDTEGSITMNYKSLGLLHYTASGEIDLVKWEQEEPNIKMFVIEDTEDLDGAQAAFDWHRAGKVAIISGAGETYMFSTTLSADKLRFVSINKYKDEHQSYTDYIYYVIDLTVTNNVVTKIEASPEVDFGFIDPAEDYATPYEPEYDGSPATKAYVDSRQAVEISREYAFTNDDHGYTREWTPNTQGKVWAECGIFDTSSADGASTIDLPITYEDEYYYVNVTVRDMGNFHVYATPVSNNQVSIRVTNVSGTPVSVGVSIEARGWKNI